MTISHDCWFKIKIQEYTVLKCRVDIIKLILPTLKNHKIYLFRGFTILFSKKLYSNFV